MVNRAFLALIGTMMLSVLAYAEGTKQLKPTASDYAELYVSGPGATSFATAGCLPKYRLNIHVANVGETILFGLQRTSGFGTPTYTLKKPDGTSVLSGNIPTTGPGYIVDYGQAIIGPYPGSGGYIPLSCQVNNIVDTGNYYIEFSGSPRFALFDFQVVTGSNVPAIPADAIDGRVWSGAWQLYADLNTTPREYFAGKFFIYNDDGIVTSLKFNQASVGLFSIFCNPYGCQNTGNFTSDRKSKNTNTTGSFPGIAQFKVFLNNPDINVYPDGVYGTMTSPPTLIPDPAFPLCSGNKLIVVNVNKAGNVEILIDVPYGGPSQDVSIYSTVNAGTNNIAWNGKDGLGNPVPDGTALHFTVNYVNGLTNLPIWDQEQNPQGYIVTLVRPINPSVVNPKTYWDDSDIPGGNCPGTTNFIGCTTTSIGCHAWGGGGSGQDCHDKTINTWWYSASSSTATLNVYHTGTPPVPTALPQYGCGPPWTINLAATVLSQEVVRWWDQPTGGTLLYTGTPYSVTPSAAGTYTYYAEAYNPASTCTSTTRASVTAQAVEIPAPPTPAGAPFYTCGPGTVTLTTTNLNPGIRVDWYDNSTPPQKIISGNSFITPVLTATTIYWARTVEIGSPAGCSSASMTQFIAEVNPNPYVTNSPPDPICSGTPFTITLTGNLPEALFTWTATANPPGSVTGYTAAQTSPTTSIDDVLINVTSSPTTVTYFLIPIINGCQGFTTPFNVTVNPTANIIQPANVSVCNGGTASTTVFTTSNTGGTTTYSWSNNNPTIGLAASGTGNLPAFTALNTGTTPAVATITVTPTFTNAGTSCQGPSKSFTISVSPAVIAGSVSNDQTICNGALPTVIWATTPNGGSGNYSYQWQKSIDNVQYLDIGGASNLNYQPPNLLVTTYYRMLQGAVGNCPMVSTDTLVINVIIVTPVISGNSTACLHSSSNLYTTQPGMTKYLWTVSPGGAITGGGSKNDNYVSVTWNTHGSQSICVSYTNPAGCTPLNATVYPISVLPLPTPSISTPPLLIESFENSGNIPQGWAIEQINAGNNLTFIGNSLYPPSFTAYHSNYFVRFDSYDYALGAIRLKRNTTVSTIGLMELSLSFAWLESNAVAVANDRVDVEWSTDGTTWNTFGSYPRYNATQGWKLKNVTLPAASLNQPSLFLAFKFTSDYGMDCYLDYVTLMAGNTVSPGSSVVYQTEPGMTNYVWNVSPGGTIISGAGTASIVVNWNTTGNQQVSVNYNNSNGCAASAPASLTVNVIPMIPALQNVSNVSIGSGQVNCYNAYQTISIAGNGTSFEVQSGGSATIIAGQNIQYLPSTTIQSGGYMRGYIAPSGPWCQNPSTPTIPGNKALINNTGDPQYVETDIGFRVYPNPTTGSFILELMNYSPPEKVLVDIYGILGDKLLSTTLVGERKHEFSLTERPTGVYLLRVAFREKAETVKIIKQ